MLEVVLFIAGPVVILMSMNTCTAFLYFENLLLWTASVQPLNTSSLFRDSPESIRWISADLHAFTWFDCATEYNSLRIVLLYQLARTLS